MATESSSETGGKSAARAFDVGNSPVTNAAAAPSNDPRKTSRREAENDLFTSYPLWQTNKRASIDAGAL
jgi:hypothetical protein